MINLRNGTLLCFILKTDNDYILRSNNEIPKCLFENDLVASLNNYFQKTFGMKYCNAGDILELYEEDDNIVNVINRNFNFELFNMLNNSKFIWQKLINCQKKLIYSHLNSCVRDIYTCKNQSNITINKKPINVVVGILIDKNNNILIQRRKNSLWEFPGGKQKINEYLVDALCREFKEELNIDLNKNCTLLQIFKNFNNEDYIFYLFSIGNQEINLNQIRVNEALEYQIINIDDLDKYEFMPVDKEKFIPYIKNIVHLLNNRVEFTNNNNIKGNEIMNTNEMSNNVMSGMNNTFNANVFNKLGAGICKYTMSGKISVKTTTGYKSYDVKTNKFTNCNNFCLPFGDNMFFVMPATKVNPGDIIILNNVPVCVIKYENNECTVINYETGKVETFVPERNFMFGNFYFFYKIVSLMGKMFSDGFKGFGGNMMKYMLMSQMMNNQNNTMNNQNCGFPGFDMNTMLMMQMMNKNKSDEDFDFDFMNCFDEEENQETVNTEK